ncbi:MAG: response regulator [Candidatus Riflebacteria bacterium]|nr:response regulator [Candidatus Riflebacteria bacterium]
MSEKNNIILVIDDTPPNLELLSTILKKEGYDVRPAISGKVALKASHLQIPDLILLDINMPEMDGFQVCRAFKSDARLAEVPIVFISAATETSEKLKAFQEGGVDYVTKPFQPLEVLARVKTHISLAVAKAELQAKNEALESTMKKLNLAQTHLVQSEKMSALGILTAGIAHELNNPLNFISGSVQGLRKTIFPINELISFCQSFEKSSEIDFRQKLQIWIENNPPAELFETINELVKNACIGSERASEIVKGLRIFSRLDEADTKKINLHENIDAALLLLRSRYNHQIKIIRNYRSLPSWICQPGKLNQVFMNLLNNSIDAILSKPDISPDETITITTTMDERESVPWLKVSISDTGIGMSDETKNHLFQPFFTTKDVGKGVGLGLAISHGIIKDHQGTIEVESSENKGSTFLISLPHPDYMKGRNKNG